MISHIRPALLVTALAVAGTLVTATILTAGWTRVPSARSVVAVGGGHPVAARGDAAASSGPVRPAASSQAVASALTSRRLEVPWYRQTRHLTCEEASLRMALASRGITSTEDQILAVIGIDHTPARYDGAELRWGDPYRSFVGDPDGSEVTKTGYGTYYPTIAEAANRLGGRVLAAGEGYSAAWVYGQILAGHPVVAWVAYLWSDPPRQDYVAFDGRRIPYAGPFEHAVTVVGVTAAEVVINNPASGVETIDKATFARSFATYGGMAVVLV